MIYQAAEPMLVTLFGEYDPDMYGAEDDLDADLLGDDDIELLGAMLDMTPRQRAIIFAERPELMGFWAKLIKGVGKVAGKVANRVRGSRGWKKLKSRWRKRLRKSKGPIGRLVRRIRARRKRRRRRGRKKRIGPSKAEIAAKRAAEEQAEQDRVLAMQEAEAAARRKRLMMIGGVAAAGVVAVLLIPSKRRS